MLSWQAFFAFEIIPKKTLCSFLSQYMLPSCSKGLLSEADPCHIYLKGIPSSLQLNFPLVSKETDKHLLNYQHELIM